MPSNSREIRVALRFEIDDEMWTGMYGGDEPRPEDFKAYVLEAFQRSSEMAVGAVTAVDFLDEGSR